jgi:hypothetical protein
MRFDGKGYVMVRLCKDGIGKNYKTHRLVAELFIPKPNNDTNLEVDHIDQDKTNNIVSNLRWVTPQQNMWNRNKRMTPSSSRYIGVTYHKRSNKWSSRIVRNDGSRNHIGMFHNEKDAARAYNDKARELRGNFAVLNDISDDED